MELHGTGLVFLSGTNQHCPQNGRWEKYLESLWQLRGAHGTAGR